MGTSADPSERRTGTVVAVTSDDDRFAAVREHAIGAARSRGAELILYDWDAPMLLGDPLPSIWSGDGADQAVPDRLRVADLEAAGRPAIANQVREAEAAGARATAWLPSKRGTEALAAYARDHGAVVVVVPSDLVDDALRTSLAGVDIEVV